MGWISTNAIAPFGNGYSIFQNKRSEPKQQLELSNHTFCPLSFLVFSFSSRWHRRARKGLHVFRPVSHQSPQGCPRNSANICFVEHRSFSNLEGGMSAASFFHSSFLKAVSAVTLWPVNVQDVPQASEQLCPAKLQITYGICCACQSIFPFIPTDSGVPRTVDAWKSL